MISQNLTPSFPSQIKRQIFLDPVCECIPWVCVGRVSLTIYQCLITPPTMHFYSFPKHKPSVLQNWSFWCDLPSPAFLLLKAQKFRQFLMAFSSYFPGDKGLLLFVYVLSNQTSAIQPSLCAHACIHVVTQCFTLA